MGWGRDEGDHEGLAGGALGGDAQWLLLISAVVRESYTSDEVTWNGARMVARQCSGFDGVPSLWEEDAAIGETERRAPGAFWTIFATSSKSTIIAKYQTVK